MPLRTNGSWVQGGRPATDHMPKFTLAVMTDPEGYKPGTYYYVLYLPEFRKVSRYLRRKATVLRKIERYAKQYAAGDRYWPEVGREDELRDSRDVIRTIPENFRRWVKGSLSPALSTYYGLPCGEACRRPPLFADHG
jgi:hypothetical protein